MQGIMILAALLAAAASAQAASVSVAASVNNGPVSVSAHATFYNGESGSVRIYLEDGTYAYASGSGEGSASCSYVFDGATFSNGSHTVRAVASDSLGSAVATDTFTIQNPVSLSATTPSRPTEALDVSGSAQFLARKTSGDWTGQISIYTKDSESSSWPSSASRAKNYYTPSVTFSCEDMSDGLFDVATWSSGSWDFKVVAKGANYETLSEITSTTIQNPISLSSEVNSHPTGPLNVTGSASFMERLIDGNWTGHISIYTKTSQATNWPSSANRAQYYYTPQVAFTCENMSDGLFDVATWSNGSWDFKVVAKGANYDTLSDIKTTTIQNPISLSSEVNTNPTGPLNVTGSASFMERLTSSQWNGHISIYTKTSQATNWPSSASRAKYYYTPQVAFTCEDMGDGLFDVATWGNGDWDFKVVAKGANYDTLSDINTTTIQNPISLSSEVNSHPAGPLNVTGSASFMERLTSSQWNGHISIYTKASQATNWPSSASRAKYYYTPQVTFTCEDMGDGLFDVATWSNGDWDFKVVAKGANYDTLSDINTTTIQNPISLSSEVDSHPTGPLNVTGSASFMERLTSSQWNGHISIYTKASQATNWPSSASRAKYYYTPQVTFTCEDMGDGLFDVATWSNGDWDFKVVAKGPNYDTLSDIKTTTIQNPISLSSQVDSHPTGPLDVTGSASFMERLTSSQWNGHISIYTKSSQSSSWPSSASRAKYYYTPQVTFTCEEMGDGLFDIASWSNGDWDFKVVAKGANSNTLYDIKSATIDNTPKVTASCPRYVSGDFDITGSAVFTEVLADNAWKGTLYINIDSQSTSYAKTKSYTKGDGPGFSYNEMAGTTLNADMLGHGEHVAYIIAKAKNGTWSEWLAVPFTTGEPEEDGSGNLVIIPQQSI